MKKLYFVGFTAIFAVLAAAVFWGAWSPDVTPVMPDDGMTHNLEFTEQFSAWFNGWLQGGVFSPITPFWDAVIVSKYWTQELKYVSGLFFAALGLAVLLRGRGLSRVASYGAGLLLGFCGYWTTLFSAGHATWFMLMSCIIPAFAVMDRAVVRDKVAYWILLGAFVGWGTFYQVDLFLLFAVLLTAYGLYACCRERKFPWKGALIALAFFGLVGAPGIRSAFTDALSGRDKQIAESAGTALTGGKGATEEKASADEKKKAADEARWIFVTNWSLPPEDTLEFFIPRIHGDTSCPMTLQLGRAAGKDVKPYTGRLGRPINASQGNYRQHSLYVGWVTCLMALGALVTGVVRKTRDRKSNASAVQPPTSDIFFFAAAALLCWLFSMGRFCEPVYRLVYALPFGDYLRAPVKWHHLTEFCLCVLAGFGLEALYQGLKARGLTLRTSVLLTALVAVVGAIDLVRIDRLYCAPIDMHVVRGRNPAADEIVRRGKGTVCDLIEGGNGLFAWSFHARGLGTTRDLTAKDTRFVWTLTEQLKRNRQLAEWLGQNASPVGAYALTQQGVRSAPANQSNAALYQINGVPPPPPPARAPIDGLILSLGLLSLCGTCVAVGCFCLLLRDSILCYNSHQ